MKGDKVVERSEVFTNSILFSYILWYNKFCTIDDIRINRLKC